MEASPNSFTRMANGSALFPSNRTCLWRSMTHAKHEVLPLAILSAFVAAAGMRNDSENSSPTPVRPRLGYVICL